MEKGKNRRGREMKDGVKKFGKPARTLASEVELPWFPAARGQYEYRKVP